MDKEYTVGKDGLPLSRNCSYFKIGENDENKLINLCIKNNIKFKRNYPEEFDVEYDTEGYLIARAENEYGLNIDNLKQQKEFINLLEKTNIVEKVQREINDTNDSMFDQVYHILEDELNKEESAILTDLMGIAKIEEKE